MSRWSSAFLRCIGLFAILPAIEVIAADAQPIVRLSLEENRITVGESVRMRLTLLVPTWQPSPPIYPSFEVPNGITRLPPDSSYPTTERIGGETWSGIVRSYQFYPLLAADYRLGGGTLRITWANPGKEAFVADVPVPEVMLEARVPEGAVNLEPFLAGTELRFTRTVSGTTEVLQVGEALVVDYEASLDGMPALFLPELAPEMAISGVKRYADEPVLDDGPPASRQERISLIPSRPGEFEVPGRRLAWWNTKTEEVVVTEVPALFVTVAGPPAEATETPPVPSRPLWPWAVAFLMLLTGAWLALPRLRQAMTARQTQRAAARRAYEASEAWAFAALNAALNADEPGPIYEAAVRWLERLEPGMDLRRFALRSGSPRLLEAVDALSEGLYGTESGAAAAFEASTFRRELPGARQAFLAAGERGAQNGLPALNP